MWIDLQIAVRGPITVLLVRLPEHDLQKNGHDAPSLIRLRGDDMASTQRRNQIGGANVGYDENAATAHSKSPTRQLYRGPNDAHNPSNIMHDRRVVRGSTYAASTLTPAARSELERQQREQEERAKKRALEARRRAAEAARERTPSPVAGRCHMDMQTETYLEILTDRVPEEEVGTQTDALMDRPPTPIFVPKPSGVDAVTQIETADLFDFDFEVAPILEVLVGKTLENALLEVLQDDELEAIRERQEEYQAIRAAELAEVQRLEAEVKRRQLEKMRRMQQEKERAAREEDVQKKVAAAAFARSYLVAMRSNVLERLRARGFFYDPLRREIETLVMPELLASMGQLIVTREQAARSLAADVIQEALQVGKQRFEERVARDKAAADAAEAAAKALAEEAEAQRLERVRKRKEAEEAARLAEEAEAAGEAEE